MQTNQKICKKGSIIQIVEAPTIQKKGGEKNENSAIVRVSCGAGSVLFTGDAPAEGELAAARWPIGSDVLKVSHHGSRTSSSEGFLAAVSPRLAVISSGRENRFGHPHPEILERLERFHIPCARTDRGGAIKVVLMGPVLYGIIIAGNEIFSRSGSIVNTTADVFLEVCGKSSVSHVVVAGGGGVFQESRGQGLPAAGVRPGEEPLNGASRRISRWRLWEKPSTPCLFSAGATGWSSKIPGCSRKRHRPENGHQREGKEGNASGTVHGTAQ